MALSKVDLANMVENVAPASTIPDVNFRNIIINGDMSIAQRGTSSTGISGNGYFSVDRFKHIISGLGTWTASQSTDVPTGQGFANSFKMDCTTADASPAAGDYNVLAQIVEGANVQHLKKGTSSAESITWSFWVKSNKTGTYICEILDGNNTRQISKSYTISSSNTWEKKTITMAGDTSGAIGTGASAFLQFNFWLAVGSDRSSGTLNTSWNSTTNANRAVGQVNLADSTSNEWYITGVQLEAGTSASEFEFLPHDVNLQRCLRYYYVHAEGDQQHVGGSSGYYNNTYLTTSVIFPTQMRSAPSLVKTSGTGYYTIYRDNSNDPFDDYNAGIQQPTKFAAGIDATTGVSGTAGQYGRVITTNASASIAFNSEL